MPNQTPKASPGGEAFSFLIADCGVSRFELVLLDQRAKLFHCANIELTDALLGDAQLFADLFQRHALDAMNQPY